MSDDFVTSAPAAEPPAVSVIIATYNRSQPLRHAIRSVCNSTLSDWEVIVVGDACTDDTAEVVSSFDDPRIRFVNLPSRCGDMSGPHNHVLPLARGRYVAFLNHDDLYLPDHLAKCVAELEIERRRPRLGAMRHRTPESRSDRRLAVFVRACRRDFHIRVLAAGNIRRVILGVSARFGGPCRAMALT